MRNRVFKTILITLAFVFTLASMSILYAWYTNVDYVGSIDAETEGLSFYYTLDDSAEKNEKTYSITNLSFFDNDNPNELSYYTSMSKIVRINIKNNDDAPKKFTITYEAQKQIKKDGEANKSVAYPFGLLSTEAIISLTSKTTINDLVPQNATNTELIYSQALEGELASNSSEIIYLHLAGIQEIDSSDNSFLFDESGNPVPYTFKITIHAENLSQGPGIVE